MESRNLWRYHYREIDHRVKVKIITKNNHSKRDYGENQTNKKGAPERLEGLGNSGRNTLVTKIKDLMAQGWGEKHILLP